MCYSKKGKLRKIKLFWVYSPHKRGWSQITAEEWEKVIVFPAQAGMILNGRERNSSRSCIPRTSGDDPQDIARVLRISEYSPHERGWSLVIVILVQFVLVFPAQAGMIPIQILTIFVALCIPRVSGDDPGNVTFTNTSVKYSPRKRGWSPRDVSLQSIRYVFPAQAGMIWSVGKSAQYW